MVATPQMALEAAAAVARAAGLAAHILSDAIEGEARDVGKVMAGDRATGGRRAASRSPTLRAAFGRRDHGHGARPGRGGRNVEFLLSLALALDGHAALHALAGDTDGVDGMEEIAGAIIGPDTLARAWAMGLRPATCSLTTTAMAFSRSSATRS